MDERFKKDKGRESGGNTRRWSLEGDMESEIVEWGQSDRGYEREEKKEKHRTSGRERGDRI